MSDVIRCDGCGEVVTEETLYFDINTHARSFDAFVNAKGMEFDWSHRDTHGDLCGECAEETIQKLNELLK